MKILSDLRLKHKSSLVTSLEKVTTSSINKEMSIIAEVKVARQK